ncbi:sugar phosphate isomerase/epimerase [Vallitalea pronyensis]|uniref:Sugar phosphate isomerase/epimerase n=1 Tax=Vallitalea pronyensis TaxID=1348613 RepID=A0A8J8SI48_9FIRM|nr:sugar phosphate isomerase/epimerase [Vallitalea pronyensis]QUI24087.1 sugar phosphate isomerase/epimerase [Vallitalea pronyensis]
MTHRLAVSGSTILSDINQLDNLLWDGISNIEIGEFADEEAFQKFLRFKKENKLTFGIHSPIIRGTSKYDFIQKVHYDPAVAWQQVDAEANRLSKIGAEYLLIHFPFFQDKIEGNPHTCIEEGLQRLKCIREKYNMEIVCEPKLGVNRSSAGIHYLHDFPVDLWAAYNLKLCVDIGDYLMATSDKILDYLAKWKDYIKVVHLHHIDYIGDEYTWVPVHPSGETMGHETIQPIIQYLAALDNITFVFEHTPQLVPSEAYVKEGYIWMRQLIYGE